MIENAFTQFGLILVVVVGRLLLPLTWNLIVAGRRPGGLVR